MFLSNEKNLMGHQNNNLNKSVFYKKYSHKDIKKGERKYKMKKKILSINKNSESI